MVSRSSNLYSSLYRWAYRQSENFCTDALVFLINQLLEEERELGLRFVNWLCFRDERARCGPNGLRVTTQVRENEGTPDIRIEADDFLCLIEVKKGSDLHHGQLRQYRAMLERENRKQTRLVLLTVHKPTIEEEEPDLHLYWSDVASWLISHAPQKPAIIFLVEQFLAFLKEEVMSFEPINWQYVEGTKCFLTFGNMLGKALGDASIPSRVQQAWDSRGYYIDGKKFWVGVYLNDPETLCFEFS